MFENLDDPEPVELRPRVEDLMREAKRRTVRRIGATSTCLVLLFGAAVTANRYFRTEQTVRIQNAAASHAGGSGNAPGNGGSSTSTHPGSTQPKTNGKSASSTSDDGNNATSPTPATSPSNNSNGDPAGSPLVNPTPVGGTSGGTFGSTVPSGSSGNTPPPSGVVWTARADRTSSPSATNAFVTVTVTVTNNTTSPQTIDFKECDPACKRVKSVGTDEIAPDWDASEGPVVASIAPGATIHYDEVIRMRTGAGFLAAGQYTLVIYGTSVPITIT
jgi:cytoskeletal protein RodZ